MLRFLNNEKREGIRQQETSKRNVVYNQIQYQSNKCFKYEKAASGFKSIFITALA